MLMTWIAEAKYLTDICTSKGNEIMSLREAGKTNEVIDLSIVVNALIKERVEYLIELESQMSLEEREFVYAYIDATLKPTWEKSYIGTLRLMLA